jgi:hypothetical protein
MPPDATGLTTLLAFTLLGVGAAISFLPVGTCSECGHCRLQKLEKERELETRAAKFYGVPLCIICGRRHNPEDDHPF